MTPIDRLYAKGRLKQGVLNKTESAYEEHLKLLMTAGEILWYSFEGLKFRLADNTSYTPDFAVMKKDGQIELHEVKGAEAIFRDDAKVKIKVAAETYPFVFKVAFPASRRLGDGWTIKVVGNKQ